MGSTDLNPSDPAPFPKITLPDGCSTDFILGQLVTGFNALAKSNHDEHAHIKARLDEGDQYLAILKVSRCTFSWLNRNGFLKWGLVGIGFRCNRLVSRTCEIMSRILDEFLKANRGRLIFIAVSPTPCGDKAGSEGILEDYDEEYVLIRGKHCLMITTIDSIISFELLYRDLKMIEVVAS